VYVEHAPEPALAPYVSCFWEQTSGGDPFRVLPDGAMDVIYDLGASGARVVGAMTRAIVTQPGAAPRVIGVRFRPGAVELLGVSGRELRDATAPIADVWGSRGRTLDARLAEALDTRSALGALAAELRHHAACATRPDPRVAAAVTALRAAGGELPIPALGALVGLGERQLERLFAERVGYGPKLFARVVRLELVTRAVDAERGSIASWARLALDSGYTDQAHLIREFRALTGVTPRVWARGRDVGNRQSGA